MENLVITGLGAVTPIGIGVEEYWQGILDQKCGINRITRFQDENVPITIAGEVKGFDPKNYMPGKLAKETGTFIQYAYASAKEAIEQSGIEIEPEADRIGIVMATALSLEHRSSQIPNAPTAWSAKKESARVFCRRSWEILEQHRSLFHTGSTVPALP